MLCFFFTSGSTLQDKDEDPVPAETGQNHPFFRRSDSMTFLGCIPPNPFDVPLAEAIPLADQPHLLQVRFAADVKLSPTSLRVILSILYESSQLCDIAFLFILFSVRTPSSITACQRYLAAKKMTALFRECKTLELLHLALFTL